jgi:hypothetical protein
MSIQFDRTITLGQIFHGMFQAGSVIVLLGGVYLTNSYAVRDLEVKVENQKQALQAAQSRLDNVESNTTAAVGRLQDLLTNLRVDVATHGWGGRK